MTATVATIGLTWLLVRRQDKRTEAAAIVESEGVGLPGEKDRTKQQGC